MLWSAKSKKFNPFNFNQNRLFAPRAILYQDRLDLKDREVNKENKGHVVRGVTLAQWDLLVLKGRKESKEFPVREADKVSQAFKELEEKKEIPARRADKESQVLKDHQEFQKQ